MSLSETILDTQPEKFGLWPSIWRLILLRARIGWNSFKRSKLRGKIGQSLFALVILILMVGLFLLSRSLLGLINNPEIAQYINPTAIIDALPTLILSAAFVVTIMTNFGVLLQSLYMSRDMDFLVTSPLPVRAVFLAKLLEAILPTFALFCAISLPVLFGLGASKGYHWIYYPLLVLMLILLALAAGGLASILVMSVARVVSARRAAEVLGFLGALFSILCGQIGNLMNSLGVQGQDVGNTVNALTRLNTPWSPLAWAGQGLTAIGRGEWGSGLGLTLLSMSLAGGLFAGTLLLAERLYYTGWATMQGQVRKKKGARKRSSGNQVISDQVISNQAIRDQANTGQPVTGQPITNPLITNPLITNPLINRLLPSPVRGMIVKDFLLLRRDPRNLSQLITPLVFGVIMLFTTRGGGQSAARALDGVGLTNFENYGLLVLAIFVGWMLLLNLSTLAFTREGRNYWMVKVAPLSPWQLILSKYAVSYLPVMAFCLAYLALAFLIQQIAWTFLPYFALIIGLSMAGATGISLAYGIAGANLEWDSPNKQRLSGAAGCMVAVVVSLYFLVELLLFLLPPTLWQIFAGGAPLSAYALGLVLGGMGAALAAFLPLRLALPRLARIGEA